MSIINEMRKSLEMSGETAPQLIVNKTTVRLNILAVEKLNLDFDNEHSVIVASVGNDLYIGKDSGKGSLTVNPTNYNISLSKSRRKASGIEPGVYNLSLIESDEIVFKLTKA